MRTFQRMWCLLVLLCVLSACVGAPAAQDAGSAPTPPSAAAPAADEPPASATAGTIDPCALLTKADAEAALGEPVEDAAVPLETPSLQGCQYLAQNAPLRSVSVQLITDAILQQARSPYTTVAAFYSAMKNGATAAHPVAGLGDQANWVTVAGVTKPQLWVLQRDVLLTIAVGEPTEANTEAASEALAKQVLARLP